MSFKNADFSAFVGRLTHPNLYLLVKASSVNALVIIVIDKLVTASPVVQVDYLVDLSKANYIPDDHLLVQRTTDEGL